MKKNFRKIFSLMIIGCLMIIMSCQGDNADESTKELDHSITHRHISFEEFTEKNAEAALGLGKQNEKVAKKIMQKDGAYDAENDFTILTDKIFMAENEGGAYYTFQISRENGNFQGLENLILKSDGNGGFSPILSKYTLSDQEIEAVAAGQPIENLNQKTEFKSIETIDFGGIVSSKETPCQMFLVCYCSGNNPDHVGGFNPDGTNCPLHAEGIAIVGDCGNGGIGNGPGNGNSDPGPGTGVPGDSPNGPGTAPGGTSGPGTGGGTGGPNNNPPGPPVITTPVVDQIALAKKKFMSSLTAAQEAWLNQKTGINNYTNPSRPVILAYLETNFYSIDGCEFVKEAINALVNNNCTILNTELLDEQITTDLPPCLTNLVNDLKSLQIGKFGQIIAQFAGNNPIPLNYNWKITTSSAPGYAAFTSPAMQPGHIVLTTINSDLIAVSTDLSLARTIIHESFHAYLISIYRFRNIDMSYSNLVNEYYAQFDNNLNDTHHHIFTVSTIINQVAAALSEYGVSKGYNLPAQFYQDMAWGGLLGTDAYNNLPQYQRDRIASTIASEQNNNNNNAHGISPKGHTICY